MFKRGEKTETKEINSEQENLYKRNKLKVCTSSWLQIKAGEENPDGVKSVEMEGKGRNHRIS
jgi:hypothetical protein